MRQTRYIIVIGSTETPLRVEKTRRNGTRVVMITARTPEEAHRLFVQDGGKSK